MLKKIAKLQTNSTKEKGQSAYTVTLAHLSALVKSWGKF